MPALMRQYTNFAISTHMKLPTLACNVCHNLLLEGFTTLQEARAFTCAWLPLPFLLQTLSVMSMSYAAVAKLFTDIV